MGDSWPLAGTAVGIAILAARFVREGNDPAEASDEIADAIRLGFARDYGRYRDGVQAVAAPVRDAAGIEVGAIALSGPVTRIDDAEIARLGALVRQAGIDISERLGYIG